jgi:quinol monooxygenase YgiN
MSANYVVTVEFVVQPGQAPAFGQLLMENARTSLQVEPGCRVFDVCVAPEAAERFFLYEVYDDAQAFQLHLAAAHFKAFDAAVKPWVVRKTVQVLQRCAQAVA